MHIRQLIRHLAKPPVKSVPDWMLGCFKRRSISFASGDCDTDTHVFWLQGRNMTIDLRLPIELEQIPNKALEGYSREALHAWANYEGWYAETVWKDNLLSWQGGCSFQVHNRWPEPGIMHRVGDCMIEFSPSAAYVEDWRFKNTTSGPLMSLRLLEETECETGVIRHRDGALIICGEWAGLVLGRPEPIVAKADQQLRDIVNTADADLLAGIFNFECSVAQGNIENGFTVNYTTQPARLAQPLLSLDGFSIDAGKGQVLHRFEQAGVALERRFSIDSIETEVAFTRSTPVEETAKRWFAEEQETLGRYF
tara:strand:+ start:6986 stop:7912 length:927 start_codon:yes stop_codon:yes gene_type:complete